MGTRPIYTPQACRLCTRSTIYLTRSGLSDHATVHHGHWYSAKYDRYVPIPEAELAAKRDLVKRGQSHRKFRKDPADHSTDGPDKPTRKVTGLEEQPSVPRRATEPHDTEERRATGSTVRSSMLRRKRERLAAKETAASPSDTRSVVRRSRSPTERRVTSCTVDLGAVKYAPPPSRASRRTSAAGSSANLEEWGMPDTTQAPDSETAIGADVTRQPERSSSEGERPPPEKARRPEGMPEAMDGKGTYTDRLL